MSASPDTLALTGVVLSPAREPVAGQRVTLSVLRPLDDGSSQSVRLATVTTDSDGFFAAPVDVAAFTGLRAPLEVTWVRDGRTSFYFLDATRAGGNAPWQLHLPPLSGLIPNSDSPLGYDMPLQTDAGLATLDAALRAALGVAEASGEDTPSVHMTSSSELGTNDALEPEETQIGGSDNAVPAGYTDMTGGGLALQAAASGSPCATGYSSRWVALSGQYKYTHAPTRLMRTLGKSSQEYVWGRSNETSLGISMDVDGKKYGGGLTGAKDDKSSITSVAKIGNHQRMMVKFKWRYQRERRVCVHNSMTLAYNTNDYRWVPDEPTGGNKIVDTTGDFACGGTGPAYNDFFGLRTTVTRESGVTYKGFFSVNGVTIDAKQLDRSEQKFTVDPDSGVNAKVCGNNASPLYADLAKEVPS